MESLRAFVSTLPLSDELKAALMRKEDMQKVAFFARLPELLAPAFPDVAPSQLAAFGHANYLYLRFVLQVDHMLDGQEESLGTSLVATQRFLDYLQVYELAVRGLANLFPTQDSFWPAFTVCKQQYAETMVLEKQLAATRPAFTEVLFDQLAAGKAALADAVVHGLQSLSGHATNVPAVVDCLRHFNIGYQYLDDVQDYREDQLLNQHTYPQYLTTQHALDHQVSADLFENTKWMQAYFYTSGTASQLIMRGQEHFEQCLQYAQQLGLPEMAYLVEYQISVCQKETCHIEQLLQTTAAAISRS